VRASQTDIVINGAKTARNWGKGVASPKEKKIVLEGKEANRVLRGAWEKRRRPVPAGTTVAVAKRNVTVINMPYRV